jgi:hypothetical protein
MSDRHLAHDGGEPKGEGQATDEEYYRAASISASFPKRSDGGSHFSRRLPEKCR